MAFALTDVPLDRSFTADSGRRFTLADLVAAAQRNFVDDQEPGWTLVALATYAGCDARWTAAGGREYGIEDVVRLAIQRDPVKEAEGGTHHLFGVAYVVRRCGETEMTGVWPEARAYLRRYVDRARALQQTDGAFSGALFESSAPPKSPSDLVFSSGHILEILDFACTADELREPWIRKAVERLCEEIESRPLSDFSDGGIYHAANALRRYRDAVSTGS